jgi:hypothetical protein
MGGSSPSAPVTVLPAPTAPTLYKSVVPLESYQDVAEAMQRAEKETAKIQGQRYQEVGTPAEIGARQAGRRVSESAAYLASLPKGDKYYSETTGTVDPYGAIRETSKQSLSDAQKAYASALARINEVPEPTISETPSWAKRTIAEGMPGYSQA